MRSGFLRLFPIILGVLTFGTIGLEAGPWNKLTRLTVHETFQVPGATLTPGQYVVKLQDSSSNRHIVQFYNEDQSKLITTTLAINNQLMEPKDETQLYFYETPANEPPALRAWFYPGDMFGQEFVYPKSQARIISKESRRNVPTLDDESARQLKTRAEADAAQAPAYIETTRIYVWSPHDREVNQQQASTENATSDREAGWYEKQKAYQRHGAFDRKATASGKTGSKTKQMTSQREVLPTRFSARMASVDAVMQRIEQHGDAFEEDFKEAINSSTIEIADRDDMIARIDRLEDALDGLQEEYNEGDIGEAHKKLRRALEIGAGVNRFMLRSEFGAADQTWAAVRNDLNALAEAHTFPAIQVVVIERAKTASH